MTDDEFREKAQAMMRDKFGLDGDVARWGSVARVQSGAYVECILFIHEPKQTEADK